MQPRYGFMTALALIMMVGTASADYEDVEYGRMMKQICTSLYSGHQTASRVKDFNRLLGMCGVPEKARGTVKTPKSQCGKWWTQYVSKNLQSRSFGLIKCSSILEVAYFEHYLPALPKNQKK